MGLYLQFFSVTPPNTFAVKLQTCYRNMKWVDSYTRATTLMQSQVVPITDYGNIVYRIPGRRFYSRERDLSITILWNLLVWIKWTEFKITSLAIAKRQVKSSGYHCSILLQMEKPWSNWIVRLLETTVNCYNLKRTNIYTVASSKAKKKKSSLTCRYRKCRCCTGSSENVSLSYNFL